MSATVPGERGPFYLLHRARRWNPQERKWMGYERKRGKLNDLNKLLLGHGNWFDTIVGDLSRLLEIRYVITLDTDTQLPRDTAAKMVGAMAHPLNRPILDPATNTVTEGYALLRPQVAISVDSAQRSWIARIFSGQPGFDPYSASVSDVYHDLHGEASFTGKGIYDVYAFDAAVGERFPENAILSHDLIEGEHARTGLINVELVEDYPATYGAFSKRKHRWVRGDWQLLPWLFAHPPAPAGRAAKNPLSALSRWKIVDNLRRSLLEISIALAAAGRLACHHAPGPLDCRRAVADADSRLRGHAAQYHSRARAPLLEGVQQSAGRAFSRKPSRHSAEPGLHSGSSLPDGRRHRSYAVARICQPCELARMGNHGAIGNCGWTAVSDFSIYTSTRRRCSGCRSFFWPVRFRFWSRWFALFGSPRPWWWDG